MASVIITFRWFAPIPGEDGKVAVLSEEETTDLRAAVEWARGKMTQEWGDTIARVDVFATKASGGDLLTGKGTIAYVATNIRYDTGEGLYDEDCPVFAKYGISRS